MRRWTRWLLLVIVLGVVGAVIWFAMPVGPMPDTQSSLTSDDAVQVRLDGRPAFLPAQEVDTGLIFYPGARVHPESYAPAARAIAERGYLVVIVPMPFNLAVLSPNRAGEVIDAFPEIEHWVIGGHSLGAAMAAQYARSNPTVIEGLVLWGGYPAPNTDLSARTIPVLSVYGTADCLATVEEIDAARRRLPPDTQYLEIEGGNHAQFGWYGDQRGDCPASISRAEQQDQAVAATVDLLRSAGR